MKRGSHTVYNIGLRGLHKINGHYDSGKKSIDIEILLQLKGLTGLDNPYTLVPQC